MELRRPRIVSTYRRIWQRLLSPVDAVCNIHPNAHGDVAAKVMATCRRSSALVSLNSATNRTLQGPRYKLSYGAKTIQQHTHSVRYSISVTHAANSGREFSPPKEDTSEQTGVTLEAYWMICSDHGYRSSCFRTLRKICKSISRIGEFGAISSRTLHVRSINRVRLCFVS